MRTLIRNGRIVTAVDDYTADVLVDDEVITMIGHNIEVQAERVIDASGKLVLPGGVDPHTHMEMPLAGTETIDTFTSGTAAAAKGGTTTIIDFPVQARGQSLMHALDGWQEKLQAHQPVVDVGFHMIISDLEGGRLQDVPTLIKEGVTSFKLFMAYKGALMVDDETIFEALSIAGEQGMLTMMHAENGGVIDVLVRRALRAGKTGPKFHASTRPALAEAEAVHSAIAIAEMAEAPIYIVHLSAERSLQHVAEARGRGQHAYAETCPQYLFLDDSVYDSSGFEAAKYVFTPPARARENQAALWRGLAFDDLSVISTDHCPFCFKGQKEMGADDFSKIPNGGPGVELRLQMVYDGGVRTGHISLNRMVDLLSTSPAKLFGLFPRKGTIAVGSDADIVVFDPDRSVTLSVEDQVSKVDYCAYEGRQVKGSPQVVLSRGSVVYEDGQVVGRPGHGAFIKRAEHMGTLSAQRTPAEPLRIQ
ncbi:MAG TPA: dihydropyrimidinase [Arthrobacter sp.]|nr:dihydropyrimidinase [Nocardioidaceae bacterium]HET7414077.1 dihydropyrimidinase [Arthrobacter sp.]